MFNTFLADTWWYSLTQRLSATDFYNLAVLRVEQGFDAVQLVVGIPPEIGPENPHAASEVGVAWDMTGHFNPEYLQLARKRFQLLNDLGLMVIVYGAWGHQIEWLGVDGMIRWWTHLVQQLDDLNVIYCLTGESNIWIGREHRLLPDRTTDNMRHVNTDALWYRAARKLHMINSLEALYTRFQTFKVNRYARQARMDQWGRVLEALAAQTRKPIILHPVPADTSDDALARSDLLAAVTVQTGHDPMQRERIWQLPHILTHKPYINLEPWYEGIRDQFYGEWQLYAYWASMMAGATAHCYGAHGIWNVGDGVFLAHWGKQTFDQARALDTPRLLGVSHRVFKEANLSQLNRIDVQTSQQKLVKIHRSDEIGNVAIYYPDVSDVPVIEKGRYFLPEKAIFIDNLPKSGSLVIIDSA